MGSATLALTIAAVAAGVGGVLVLERSSRVRVDSSALIRALLALSMVGVLAWLGFLWSGIRLFGTIHLAYLGVVLALPLLGAAVVVATLRRPHHRAVRVLGVVLVVPAALGFYATHVEPNRLRVDRIAVPVARDRAGDDPVRVAVMSDLQTNRIGPFESRVVDRVLAVRPDVILVPGDLFQDSEPAFVRSLPRLQALLARLRAPGGVFVVQGDVDGADRVERAFATNPDARILADEVVTVRVGDRLLRIGGTRLAFDSPAAVRVKRRLAGGPEDGSFRILLSHRPDTVFGLGPTSRVDLTVAGHTHGGQVVIPGIGPLMTMTDVPRSVARGGLHELDGNRIYVSPGIGLERENAPQVRFNDPPTIGVLELREPGPA